MSFYLNIAIYFYAILCAKILRVNWALERFLWSGSYDDKFFPILDKNTGHNFACLLNNDSINS
jgi:hypothetical protein